MRTVGIPKKLHLLFISLSVSALFFFSYCRSSLRGTSAAFSKSNSILPPNNISIVPQFTFLIKVLTFDRIHSLTRCLSSLVNADYDGDPIHLHIYIDHFARTNDSLSALDQKLEESRRILEFVDLFDWIHGDKVVHYRTGNVGLQAQWVEAWWPASDNEFVFVAEDDIEVSPFFYKFGKRLILTYYYDAYHSSSSIFGASLQRSRFVPGKHGNKIQLDNETHLFLYQLVGTWGQILFPKPWKEFRLWYEIHKNKGMKPFLDGMVTTRWYNKMGERIWTPWFIKFIQSRGYFNIYTNFKHQKALSISHREAGVSYWKSVGPDTHLVDQTSLCSDSLRMPPLGDLKWYDFCFQEVIPGRLVRSVHELPSFLMSMQKLKTLLLVNLLETPACVVRNLLCYLEMLNIQNYVLMGMHSDSLLDLSRRGHPVILMDTLYHSIMEQKPVGFFQYPHVMLAKDFLVISYVIDKCLEYGYDSFVANANLLFIDNMSFYKFIDPMINIYLGNSSGIFFARSSLSFGRKSWADLWDRGLAFLPKTSFSAKNSDFGIIVRKILEHDGAEARIVDDSSFGLRIGAHPHHASSQLPVKTGKKFVYWSPELAFHLIQKKLQELNMWIIDADCSCLAVVCRPQS